MPTLMIIILILSWLSPLLGDEIVMTILTLAYFWYTFNPKELEPRWPAGNAPQPPPPDAPPQAAGPTIIDVDPEDP